MFHSREKDQQILRLTFTIDTLGAKVLGFLGFFLRQCGSEPGVIWAPKGHVTISGHIFGCHNCGAGVAPGIQ